MSTIHKVVKKVKGGFFKEMVYELKWIFQLASQYRRLILAYAGFSLLSTLISLSFSVKSKDLVDLLILNQWAEVIQIALYYAGVGAVNIGISMMIQRMAAVTNSRVKKEISEKVYEKILSSRWQSIIQHHSGDLMSRMNEDIATISGCTVGWIPSLLTQGIQLMISVGVILYYDASMIVVIAIAAPIVLLGSRIFLGKVYEQNKKQRQVSSELMTFEKETFQNIQSIKAFDLKQHFYTKMLELQQKRQTADLNSNKYSIASWAVMYMSGQAAALICLGWAIYHVYTGKITLGTLTLMAVLAVNVSASFKSLIQLIPTAMSTVASSERVRGILELPEELLIEEKRSTDFLEKAKKYGSLVLAEQLSFTYENGKKVLDQVSFSANPGEIVALVGPSGEGKTTMLRLLLGIITPEQGKAYLQLGENHMEQIFISPSTRKLIAYVPQGNTMMNGTIADNMRMVHPEATDEEIKAALSMACAWEFVEKLPDGILHMIGESGGGFSEGQNQRLAIARALLCRAPILLLDEATSALDVMTERKILHNVMRKEQYRTCILTTHRPSVLSMCDKVYRIAEQSVKKIDGDEIRKLMDEF